MIALSELDSTELVVLIGLAKQVIRADKVVSDDEKAWLAKTAAKVGPEHWTEGIGLALDEFQAPDDVREAALALERQEAKEAIYGALMGLAESDDYVYEEARILDWVARVWNIGDHVPMRR